MDDVDQEDVIDLTKSPPDPATAPPLQTMEAGGEVSVPASVTSGTPNIRPRILFPPEGSLAMRPIIIIQVKIFLEDCCGPSIINQLFPLDPRPHQLHPRRDTREQQGRLF